MTTEGNAPAAVVPSGAPEYEPMIFLDTNNLHWASLFIEFAEPLRLHPVGHRDPGDTAGELEGNFVGRTLADYRKGAKVIEFLRDQCSRQGARVEYSPITTLELICGLLRGRAMLDAAQARLAHRMWGHIDEVEILERLNDTAYQEVERQTRDLEAAFLKAGVRLAETTSDRIREVWLLARRILGSVYLDLGDVVVYASALLAEADILMSGDGYLRRVANGIANPGALADSVERSYYSQAQQAIKRAVADITGFPIGEIVLPPAPERFGS